MDYWAIYFIIDLNLVSYKKIINPQNNKPTFAIRRKIVIFLWILIIFVFWIFWLSLWIEQSTKNQIFFLDSLETTEESTLLIPWAWIYGDQPWRIYQERLNTALQLLKINPQLTILISADNSRENYNETAVGLHYLLKHKVDTGNIFLDFAGFDTYDSLYRAKAIFQAEKLIIISQDFALPRALFIANQLNIAAIWVIAWSGKVSFRNFLREKFANIKALLESTRKLKPHFLGEPIPLSWKSNSWEFLEKANQKLI